ncbi:hypothetical protein SOCE26_084390 [Sorangium cellulosum]|uniref:Secreted protein n=1 Tax=Sorangium cellulosum TaxID=56 RepID=A0A2L0F664_SORCE|nr:hypothetical protein [Sorangium cellulosum]AUX46929.1 hypothetical protein SOCE26_084390 [Sorangium cellulosum]
MRARGLALALCAALLVPREARAGEGAEVIVVRPPRAGTLIEEAAVRLAGELRAAGLSARFLDGTPGVEGRAQIEAPGGAFAAIAIVETEGGAVADVWVADRAAKRTIVRRVALGDPGTTNAASDLAVGSAELFRASLLDLSDVERRKLPEQVVRWISEAPRPAAVAPATEPARAGAAAAPAGRPAATRTSAAPPRRAPRSAAPRGRAPGDLRLGLEAGIAVLAGGFGAVPGPYVRVDHGLPSGFRLRGTFVPAAVERRLDAPAGSVALGQTAALVGVSYAAGGEVWPVHPVIAIDAGVYHLSVDGRANPPHRDRRQTWLTAGVSLGGGLGVRLLPQLTALAQLDVLLLAREPVVTIAGAEVGRTGRPVFLPSLGLRLGF